MGGMVVIGLLLLMAWINKVDVDERLDNYPVSKIDNTKLNRDAMNGVSVAERRRRCVNGYYDKDE